MFKKFVNRLLTFGLVFSLLGGVLVPSLKSVVYAESSSSSSSPKSSKKDESKSSKSGDGDKDENESGAKSNTKGSSSDGSANGRISTYINFAEGKTLDSALVKTLNTEQIRFMGVFLSNFYTPWMTDLGSGSDKTSKAAQERTDKT